MNSTPNSGRFVIGIFGKCNSGKSSLINAITNQNIATTSKKKGTTCDPVFKAMELPKIGPSVFIDTPGVDDYEKDIGKLKVKRSFEILNYVDFAIVVVEYGKNIDKFEKDIIEKLKCKNIKFIVAINKCDLHKKQKSYKNLLKDCIYVKISAKTKENIDKLMDTISYSFEHKKYSPIISDLLSPMDVVLLVIVIDEAYPKERLILPQQQLIYDILKSKAICQICDISNYENFLKNIKVKPKLIVTDSQIFKDIFEKTPQNVLVTSFSILLAKQKGILKEAIKGVKTVENICTNDNILICESCTHKKKPCDIGSVMIPKLILKYTKKNLNFTFKTGVDFDEDIKKYKLVIHCGGCMINENKIRYRFEFCKNSSVAITNYGVLIAYLNGVLKKSTLFLDKLKKLY